MCFRFRGLKNVWDETRPTKVLPEQIFVRKIGRNSVGKQNENTHQNIYEVELETNTSMRSTDRLFHSLSTFGR